LCGIRLRSTDKAFSVRPSFVLPYLAGETDDVQGPPFLRAFGVPFRVLARVFGKNPMYWYRLGKTDSVAPPRHPSEGPLGPWLPPAQAAARVDGPTPW
jgi:hypothetical protein